MFAGVVDVGVFVAGSGRGSGVICARRGIISCYCVHEVVVVFSFLLLLLLLLLLIAFVAFPGEQRHLINHFHRRYGKPTRRSGRERAALILTDACGVEAQSHIYCAPLAATSTMNVPGVGKNYQANTWYLVHEYLSLIHI